MLDRHLRPLIDPFLDRLGTALVRRGLRADAVTVFGLVLGLLGAAIIALGAPGWVALVAILAGRVADGLDGAMARAEGGEAGPGDFGGFLDITSDFAVYGAVPLAFALRDPSGNALAAAFLLASFYLNGATFLAFAAAAARRGITTQAQGVKSLYYSAGLLEGAETILFFVALCLWPLAFAPMAWVFGALCLVTAAARMALARRVLG